MACTHDIFIQSVARHELTVALDIAGYTHLRLRRPDTMTMWFDIVAWPGALVINGDMGCYVFSRTQDMFAFFRGDNGRINPHYWSEKLLAPGRREGAMEFRRGLFDEAVALELEGLEDDDPRRARAQQMLEDLGDTDDERECFTEAMGVFRDFGEHECRDCTYP